MSSGWFDCTEPSLTTSLEGKQGVHGAYALVRAPTRESEGCRVLSQTFAVVQAH